ncbi:MAPEG family protein [Thalassotalea mangrovi]|uniref:MAPEG family protein n=1 Tax=Thalassotalea mangrovi TaxID=2572245 RepID=A0A4U1BAI9_9GAMM|nr:MAPEG family protein [Thalassotalea mangrovi]TKB47157.1 MAPEG family protein [Thalassotalea mangrovi]
MTIQLWCLFIAGLLHPLSKLPLIKAQAQCPGGYDNNNPREQQASLTGWGKRALAAHQNQIESLPLFASGVLVTMVADVSSSMVSFLAITYVIARIVYLILYVKDISTLRSLIWIIGYLSSLALLISPAWGN